MEKTQSQDINENEVNKYSKDYSESGFWEKIKKFAFKIGVKPIYIALLLYYSIPKLSILDKAIVIGSLGYLISPLDLILDTIPVIGLADDIGVLMFAYYRIRTNIDDETRQKAKDKVKSIFGNFDENIINEL